MGNPVHLLTVAALLLAAFLVGAVAGSAIRLLVVQLTRKTKRTTVATAMATPAATVSAPAPAAVPPAPASNSIAPPSGDAPVPDFAATLLELAKESPPIILEPEAVPQPDQRNAIVPMAGLGPARVAGEAMSGRRVMPVTLARQTHPESDATAERTADVIRFIGLPVPTQKPAQPEPAASEAAVEVAADLEPMMLAKTTVAGEPAPVEGVASDSAPVVELTGETEAAPASAAVTVEAPVREPPDEDAAMRAIEGSWTPRRARARPPRQAPPPDGVNEAVAASARAVAAARRTAEIAVAEAAPDTGRPAGLDAPRGGQKDELTHIIGVLPVIETALNKLGIFHFDQVAQLTDENLGWVEAHLGVPGRIGREMWREQARELAAVVAPKRAAEH